MSGLREVLDGQMTEDDMRSQLEAAAVIGRWFHWHARDSRRQDLEAWPDDWFLRDGELLFWELKRVRGKLTPGQAAVLGALERFITAHGLEGYCEARVVRPADLPECIERLTGGTVRPA